MNNTEDSYTSLQKMPESHSKVFSSNLKQLPKMLAFVRIHAKCFGLSQKVIKQVELAAEEALVNVISYAYSPVPRGKVKISCVFMEDDKLLLEIIDQGAPYNPLEEQIESPKELSLKQRKIGGLGRLFILQLMDDVTYERRNNSNVLGLIKHRNG